MSADQKRFVVLRHDYPCLHWDFLLERDENLESWRLLREPVSEEWIRAEPLPDHRSVYLTYEGPVSGDRGTVSRILSGKFESSKTEDVPSEMLDGVPHPADAGSFVRMRRLRLAVEMGHHLPACSVAELFRTKDGRHFWMFRLMSET